jgi:hypothetical protein
VRKQVLRRRRIYTSFAGTWERLRAEAQRLRPETSAMELEVEIEAQPRAA